MKIPLKEKESILKGFSTFFEDCEGYFDTKEKIFCGVNGEQLTALYSDFEALGQITDRLKIFAGKLAEDKFHSSLFELKKKEICSNFIEFVSIFCQVANDFKGGKIGENTGIGTFINKRSLKDNLKIVKSLFKYFSDNNNFSKAKEKTIKEQIEKFESVVNSL